MQVRPAQFDAIANAGIRKLNWATLISFDKAYDSDITFFTLDQSQLNGMDILAPVDDNPLQVWDFYEYINYTERLLNMTVDMRLDFPYSVVSTIADFTLNNYDDYFTPLGSSPIAPYILPKRPVRLLMGFKNTNLPQFVGLTKGNPDISDENKTASFTAYDFLTQIFDMPIRDTIAMANVRTDEVLANIFAQFGLAPTQYDLGKGRNVIPFLFFEKDQQTAGDVIRYLMQAEMGWLWLAEDGINRFKPRLEQPTAPSYLFDDTNINSASVVDKDDIINRVVINTDVRKLQEYQYVYSKPDSSSELHVVPASASETHEFALQDPCLVIEEPDFGDYAGVSWFTAALPSGASVLSNVSITSVELKTNAYAITFQNTNAFAVNINEIWLYGRPGKRISLEPLIYENKEQDSIDKYEDNLLEISNNFIQSVDQARSLAYTILDEYSEYADVIELDVKGNPAIQLSDIVTVDYENYSAEYRVIGIKNSMTGSQFTQVLTLRKYTPRTWFQLDVSLLNGTDNLAP